MNCTKKYFLNSLKKVHNSYHVGCLGETLIQHLEWMSKGTLAYFSGWSHWWRHLESELCQPKFLSTVHELAWISILRLPSDFLYHLPTLAQVWGVWDSPGASGCFSSLCQSFLVLSTQLNKMLLPLRSSLRTAGVIGPGFHSCQALRSTGQVMEQLASTVPGPRRSL